MVVQWLGRRTPSAGDLLRCLRLLELVSLFVCLFWISGIAGSYGNSSFTFFFEKLPHCFPQWLPHYLLKYLIFNFIS